MKRRINTIRTLAITLAIVFAGALGGHVGQPAATGPFLGAKYAEAKGVDALDTVYQGVVVVAKAGGDFTSITAALNSITNNSADNLYLVWVAPGVYTETVTMKDFVDIEGSGEKTTRITFPGSGAFNTATVRGANNAELRFLTVENTGGNTYATAIYNSGASPSLLYVTVTASGASSTNRGMYNFFGSSPTISNATISASGGSSTYGLLKSSSSPTITNVTVSASGGTVGNYGVRNDISSPTMSNVTVSASGGSTNYGVYNSNGSPTMTDLFVSASGGNSYGVRNDSSSHHQGERDKWEWWH